MVGGGEGVGERGTGASGFIPSLMSCSSRDVEPSGDIEPVSLSSSADWDVVCWVWRAR